MLFQLAQENEIALNLSKWLNKKYSCKISRILKKPVKYSRITARVVEAVSWIFWIYQIFVVFWKRMKNMEPLTQTCMEWKSRSKKLGKMHKPKTDDKFG